jgi:hypothetical protein
MPSRLDDSLQRLIAGGLVLLAFGLVLAGALIYS